VPLAETRRAKAAYYKFWLCIRICRKLSYTQTVLLNFILSTFKKRNKIFLTLNKELAVGTYECTNEIKLVSLFAGHAYTLEKPQPNTGRVLVFLVLLVC
jgi:hypothetical protein